MGIIDELAGIFHGGLTKPGMQIPGTPPQYFDNQQQALAQGNQAIANIPPSTLGLTPATAFSVAPNPSDSAPLEPGVSGPVDPNAGNVGAPSLVPLNGGLTDSAPQSNLPRFLKAPSFQDATTDPMTGMAKPALGNPSTTKLGKFVSFLQAAGNGAMAGEASAHQALQASGGHRGGNFGSGFVAAQQAPVQQALAQQSVQRGGIENQMQQVAMQQAQTPVQYKGRTVPYWMAQRQMGIDKSQADINKDAYTPNRTGGFIVNATGEIVGAPNKPEDKMSHSYVGSDGLQHVIYQRPDNTSYDVPFGAVNQKDEKPAPTIETAGGIMQWNPATSKYDIRAGSLVPKPAASGGMGGTMTTPHSELIKAMGEGRAPWPNTRTAQGATLAAEVTNAYPGSDASTYPTQEHMRVNATSGKLGGQINSLNTVNEHINNALTNLPPNGRVPLWNSVSNRASSATGGNPTGPFDVDAVAIAGEWSKMVTNGVATQGELEHIKTLLDHNAPVPVIQRNLAEVQSLTNGKLQAIQKQISSGALTTSTRPISSVPTTKSSGNGNRPPLSSFEHH